jgi:hypothetical protein
MPAVYKSTHEAGRSSAIESETAQGAWGYARTGLIPGGVVQTDFRSTVSGGADERASSRVCVWRRAISRVLIVS